MKGMVPEVRKFDIKIFVEEEVVGIGVAIKDTYSVAPTLWI